jgi:hypothetical protein
MTGMYTLYTKNQIFIKVAAKIFLINLPKNEDEFKFKKYDFLRHTLLILLN